MNQVQWSKPENIEVVKNAVKNSPDNLSRAFDLAAKELNSTSKAVSQAWYAGIRSNSGVNFKTTSSKVSKLNGKNTPRKDNGVVIHEKIISTVVLEGMRIETVKKYYAV